MRAFLLLVATVLFIAGAIIAGFTTAPDINTVLALDSAGLAAWVASELLDGRFP